MIVECTCGKRLQIRDTMWWSVRCGECGVVHTKKTENELQLELLEVSLQHWDAGHSGEGWYTFDAEYPDEGSCYWGARKPTQADLDEYYGEPVRVTELPAVTGDRG